MTPFLPPSVLERLAGKGGPRFTRAGLVRAFKTLAAVALFVGLVLGLGLVVLKV